MGSSSPQGNTTTTTNTTPWAGQQPYLTTQFQDAASLLDRGAPAYYPNDTYVGLSPLQQNAIGAQYARAANGSPVMGAADRNITDTLNGTYLNPASNPFLTGTYNLAAGNVEQSLRSAWGGQDALPGSSGAQQGAMATADANLASGIYGGAYNAERQNQLAAAGMAPQLANQDYTDIAAAEDAGSQLQQNQQNETNADIQRYNYNQNKDWNNLANYAGFVGGNYGGSSTTTQPYFGKSPVAQGLGLGAGAYGLSKL
jgi:hypothetical protein